MGFTVIKMIIGHISLTSFKAYLLRNTFAVAGLACNGETIISDAQMVEKSFDSYIPEMIKAGANYQLMEK